MAKFLLSDTSAILKYSSSKNCIFAYIKNSHLNTKVLSLLWDLGYIRGFTRVNLFYIKVYLKFYFSSYVIRQCFCISLPSNRYYFSYKVFSGSRINNYLSTNSNLIISTSIGLMTDTESTLMRLGGEPVLYIC